MKGLLTLWVNVRQRRRVVQRFDPRGNVLFCSFRNSFIQADIHSDKLLISVFSNNDPLHCVTECVGVSVRVNTHSAVRKPTARPTFHPFSRKTTHTHRGVSLKPVPFRQDEDVPRLRILNPYTRTRTHICTRTVSHRVSMKLKPKDSGGSGQHYGFLRLSRLLKRRIRM